MNNIRKRSAWTVLLERPTASSQYFVSVDDDNYNVYTSPIMGDKYILVLVQNSKNIIDADFEVESKLNNASPVPTPSEMRSIMKSSYLDAHSNSEMSS
ncbi:hypothetical protein TNCV_4700691 [Trichonephila clavipes]|nr:hypothetical protein TNCV_4700691 [Trichonephila clavipes]